MVQQDKYVYTPLSDVPAAAGQKVNVFGVVVLADNIRHSQGTDFFCTLLLADTTCYSPGYAVNLFAPRADQLPQVANAGDIIRIHRMMSTVIHRGPLGTARTGLGSISAHALFSGAPGASLQPYSFSHKSFFPLSDGHKQLVQQLRAWAHGFPFLIRPPTAPEPLLTISSIDADIAFDLCVQVWHIVKKDRMVVLFVWDGTDLPLPSLSARCSFQQQRRSCARMQGCLREQLQAWLCCWVCPETTGRIQNLTLDSKRMQGLNGMRCMRMKMHGWKGKHVIRRRLTAVCSRTTM